PAALDTARSNATAWGVPPSAVTSRIRCTSAQSACSMSSARMCWKPSPPTKAPACCAASARTPVAAAAAASPTPAPASARDSVSASAASASVAQSSRSAAQTVRARAPRCMKCSSVLGCSAISSGCADAAEGKAAPTELATTCRASPPCAPADPTRTSTPWRDSSRASCSRTAAEEQLRRGRAEPRTERRLPLGRARPQRREQAHPAPLHRAARLCRGVLRRAAPRRRRRRRIGLGAQQRCDRTERACRGQRVRVPGTRVGGPGEQPAQVAEPARKHCRRLQPPHVASRQQQAEPALVRHQRPFAERALAVRRVLDEPVGRRAARVLSAARVRGRVRGGRLPVGWGGEVVVPQLGRGRARRPRKERGQPGERGGGV
ncbi:hypothetical protein T492DRAFT_1066689, partial [Pavlovales sp. CCMP2436]